MVILYICNGFTSKLLVYMYLNITKKSFIFFQFPSMNAGMGFWDSGECTRQRHLLKHHEYYKTQCENQPMADKITKNPANGSVALQINVPHSLH